MISWRMVAAWVVALVLTTALTWQIVGLADSQVGETPVAVAPSLTSSPVGGPTTSAVTSTPTSTADAPPQTSVTSSPSSTATTDTSLADWSVRTINSEGGTVVVRYRPPDEVELQAATPAAGFGMEIDEPGPSRVRVEFESHDDDIRVEARWENGEFVVSVDSDEGGESGG